MKAVGYLRTARVTQDTPDLGRGAIQAYADARGLEVVGWYTDAGVNGLVPFVERPAGAALLAAAALGEFATVLVPSWDRVGRSAEVVNGAAAQLSAAGVTLQSAGEGGRR